MPLASSLLPPMIAMTIMLGAQLLAFKVLAWPRRRGLMYLLWPGTDPRPFEVEPRPDPGGVRLIMCGVVAIGVAVVAAVWALVAPRWAQPWLMTFAVMCNSLFGIGDLTTGMMRRLGIPVGRICTAPWAATSLRDFWGARWNMAFHYVAFQWIYKPVARRFNRPVGVAATFLFSGILHELVISLPARGGWGLPTLYFAIHGVVILLEGRGSRLLTWATVVLPLPLLFHGPFMSEVMMPLVRVL